MTNVEHVEFDLAFREGIPFLTITDAVEGFGRYVRQTRCPSDVGIVTLRLEHYIGRKHIRVEWSVEENVIPARFMSAILEGVKAGLDQFAAQGLIVRLKVSVVDGAYHEIDSWERSYRFAAHLALKDAITKATLVEIQWPPAHGAI